MTTTYYLSKYGLSMLATAILCLGLGVIWNILPGDCTPTKSKACPVPVEPLKPGHPETLNGGWVRSMNWEQRSFNYETVDGFTRIIGPVCRHTEQIPVWENMGTAGIQFHWDADSCYVIDGVQHFPERDSHPAPPAPPPAPAQVPILCTPDLAGKWSCAPATEKK